MIIQSGDTLIVMFNVAVTQNECERIKKLLIEQLANINVIVMDNCAGAAVYRSENVNDKHL